MEGTSEFALVVRHQGKVAGQSSLKVQACLECFFRRGSLLQIREQKAQNVVAVGQVSAQTWHCGTRGDQLGLEVDRPPQERLGLFKLLLNAPELGRVGA